mmetsp:Transcript_39448/g.88954  ORF Transcript_39448/g.88954 Transcript_39448/m.88954 type:complete len:220 (+) Transcript_39448:604-1263(+)
MPFASSWKDRERIGGGMLRTPDSMFSTMRNWIHENSSSTLQSDCLMVFRLSLSMPAGSMSLKLKAWMSSIASRSALTSSSSARAAAWSMLTRRTSVFLNLIILSCGALECLQNAMRALHASNHSARIWWVAVQPSQKRLYACEVRKTMRNPTKKLKPLHACVWLRMLSFCRMKSRYPRSIKNFISAASTAQGNAIREEAGKTLPLIWKSFRKYHGPPLV